jgi:hypothetical protein
LTKDDFDDLEQDVQWPLDASAPAAIGFTLNEKTKGKREIGRRHGAGIFEEQGGTFALTKRWRSSRALERKTGTRKNRERNFAVMMVGARERWSAKTGHIRPNPASSITKFFGTPPNAAKRRHQYYESSLEAAECGHDGCKVVGGGQGGRWLPTADLKSAQKVLKCAQIVSIDLRGR